MLSSILYIRIAQAVLSVITLGLAARTASALDGYQLDSLNFLIFCCVWTWFVLAYLVAVPQFLPAFHNQWAVLGVESVTMIFWFAGFIAWAAKIGTGRCYGNDVCGTAKAAAAFGAFMWLLFVASLVIVCRAWWLQRQNGDTPVPNRAPAYVASNDMETANTGFNPSETPKPYDPPVTQPQFSEAPTSPYNGGNYDTGAYTESTQGTPYQAAPEPVQGHYGSQYVESAQETPYPPAPPGQSYYDGHRTQ